MVHPGVVERTTVVINSRNFDYAAQIHSNTIEFFRRYCSYSDLSVL
jgi:hypothetical protein